MQVFKVNILCIPDFEQDVQNRCKTHPLHVTTYTRQLLVTHFRNTVYNCELFTMLYI